MTRIVIAVASALALAAGAARATDDKSPAGTKDSKVGASAGTSAAPAAGTSASADKAPATASTDAPVSGDVKSTDPAAMIITIVLPSGDEQQLNVGKDAQITRDGSTASVSQVQQGDNVRASFDPSTHKASKLDVKSKSGSKSKDSQKDAVPQKDQSNQNK